MSEAEETKENERSREEERDFSEGMDYTQEERSEQAQGNENRRQEAETKADDAFNRATAARDEKHKLQGQILGGKAALPKFTPEIARRTFNLVNTSEIDPATDLQIKHNGKILFLKDQKSFDPKIINTVLNVTDDVAKAIAKTLTDLPGPSERLQYLAERGTDDFEVEGFYNEYDPIIDVGSSTHVKSSAKNVREVMKNARSLIEGKIAKFGGVKEVEIKGAKYKVEGTVILKDGETFFDFGDLKGTMDNLSAATEKLEKMEREGRSPEDVETQRGVVAEERSKLSKFFDGITLKGLAQGIQGLFGIVALVFVITQVIDLENLLRAWVNDRKKEISGCYLISNDTYLQDQNPKCVSCASATFKVSSCSNTTCCSPFPGSALTPPLGFKQQHPYWYIGVDSKVECAGNLTHPSYLSVEKCYNEAKTTDKDIDRPQLSAEAVAELNTHGISGVQTSPLPLSLSTGNGSVTYGIRKLSSSDALTEVACNLEKALCNVGSGIGNFFLKIALPILIVCGLFYFIKFEYDKHDGKVKAKYRK